MTKYLSLYLYGSLIILAGVFLIFSENSTFTVLKLTVGIALMVGALFAIITAFSRQRNHVQFVYHEMHALAMLVYGIALVMFCDSPEKLITFTTFLFIFYSFSEIIFCNWLFNLGQKVVYNIVIIRVLLGLIIGIGTIVAMNSTEFTMHIFGILFILVGINVIFYVPVMKSTQSINLSKDHTQ